tara:strand:- start:21 stop:554 length:534 start_codon:yes stop_codon:yes gene_type:complete
MAMTLLGTSTFSGAGSVNTIGTIDDTYKLYIFKLINIDQATEDTKIQMAAATVGGSFSGVTKTTTSFRASHEEGGDNGAIAYQTGQDVANDGSVIPLTFTQGAAADESACGEVFIFNPSNTTYVKHWFARMTYETDNVEIHDTFTSGYFNTTSAIDNFQFSPSSGTFTGTIKLYGVG